MVVWFVPNLHQKDRKTRSTFVDRMLCQKNKNRDVLELNLSQTSAALFLAASASLLTLLASVRAASNAAWTYGREREMDTLISAQVTKITWPRQLESTCSGFVSLKNANRIGGGWVTENTMWLKRLAFWMVKITDWCLDVDGFSTLWSNQIGCWSFSLLWSNQIVSIILVVLFFHPGVSTLVISGCRFC